MRRPLTPDEIRAVENMPLDPAPSLPEPRCPVPGPEQTVDGEPSTVHPLRHPLDREALADKRRQYGEWKPGPFPYHGYDAFTVARDALVRGESLVASLPEGHRSIVDDFRHALLDGYTDIALATTCAGRHRADGFRHARGHVVTAAALLEALIALGLPSTKDSSPITTLLSRLNSILLRLA